MAIIDSTNDHDRVECIPEDYDGMVKQSLELCKQIAGEENKQILILQTTDDKLYKAIVEWSPDSPDAAEQALFDAIGEKDTITRLLCCWSNGALDLPSYRFRKKLCELNPKNGAARMLLNGEKSLMIKSVRETFPKADTTSSDGTPASQHQ